MLLALDLGNTNLVIGLMQGPEVVHTARLATDRSQTSHGLLLQLRQLLDVFNVSAKDLTDGIISSVVPELTVQLAQAAEMLIGHKVLIVGQQGVGSGLQTDIDQPQTLGADRIADAVGAIHQYDLPLMIVDMGTATTISVIDKRGHHIGGMIIPGARTSLTSLSQKASQLPHITIQAPEHLIGRNTVECMQSGIVYGYASMIDGLIDRIEKDQQQPFTVVATGGISQLVLPHCHHQIQLDPDLLLKGLYYIYSSFKSRSIEQS